MMALFSLCNPRHIGYAELLGQRFLFFFMTAPITHFHSTLVTIKFFSATNYQRKIPLHKFLVRLATMAYWHCKSFLSGTPGSITSNSGGGLGKKESTHWTQEPCDADMLWLPWSNNSQIKIISDTENTRGCVGSNLCCCCTGPLAQVFVMFF